MIKNDGLKELEEVPEQLETTVPNAGLIAGRTPRDYDDVFVYRRTIYLKSFMRKTP